jgi:hypothetical protein
MNNNEIISEMLFSNNAGIKTDEAEIYFKSFDKNDIYAIAIKDINTDVINVIRLDTSKVPKISHFANVILKHVNKRRSQDSKLVQKLHKVNSQISAIKRFFNTIATEIIYNDKEIEATYNLELDLLFKLKDNYEKRLVLIRGKNE